VRGGVNQDLCRTWLYGIKAPQTAARTSPPVRRAPPKRHGRPAAPLRPPVAASPPTSSIVQRAAADGDPRSTSTQSPGSPDRRSVVTRRSLASQRLTPARPHQGGKACLDATDPALEMAGTREAERRGTGGSGTAETLSRTSGQCAILRAVPFNRRAGRPRRKPNRRG